MDREQLAREIKTVITGFNGVFTDNRELEGAPFQGNWRSHYDGQGVSFLRAIGIKVIIVTNKDGEGAEYIKAMVRRWNDNLPSSSNWMPVGFLPGVRYVKQLEMVEDFLKGGGWPQLNGCAVMEHDFFFAPLLKEVVLPACPSTAEPAIRKYVEERGGFVSIRSAGNGAFRDFANFILQCRGVDPFTLSPE